MQITISRPNRTKYLILALLYLLGAWFVWRYLPVRLPFESEIAIAGIDWRFGFYPAIQSFWRGGDPYAFGVFNPPWAFPLLTPFALLPPDVGAAALFMVSLFGYAYAARRLGASWPVTLVIALSLPSLLNATNGNIDWLVVVGFTLPPQYGLFLVLLKPQLGGAVGLFWLVQAWRAGGRRAVLRTLAPVTAALLISLVACLILGWPWPVNARSLVGCDWNVSIWPYGIPLGLALLAASLRWRHLGWAICASPFLSPYVGPASWAILPLGLLPMVPLAMACAVGLWLVSEIPVPLFAGIWRLFLRP